jgi:hypothetical protein
MKRGYIVFKCCKVLYDDYSDNVQQVETRNPFVKFCWWLIETFNLWDGRVYIEDEEE